jgi:hypothetical protein
MFLCVITRLFHVYLLLDYRDDVVAEWFCLRIILQMVVFGVMLPHFRYPKIDCARIKCLVSKKDGRVANGCSSLPLLSVGSTLSRAKGNRSKGTVLRV